MRRAASADLDWQGTDDQGAPVPRTFRGRRHGSHDETGVRAERRPPATLRWLAGPRSAARRLGLDLIAAALGGGGALLLIGPPGSWISRGVVVVLFASLLVLGLAVRGAYRKKLRAIVLDRLAQVISASATSALLSLAVSVIMHWESPGRTVLTVWTGSTLAVLLLAGITSGFQRIVRLRGMGRNMLLVGEGDVGNQIVTRLREHPEYGLTPVHVVEPSASVEPDGRARAKEARDESHGLVTHGELRELIGRHAVEHVFFAFSAVPDRCQVALIRECERLGVEVSVVPRFFEVLNDRSELEYVGGLPLVRVQPVNPEVLRVLAATPPRTRGPRRRVRCTGTPFDWSGRKA